MRVTRQQAARYPVSGKEPKKLDGSILNDEEFKEDIKNFVVSITLYGLLLNYVAFVIFGMPWAIWLVPAFPGYGIAFWFLKEECPRVFQRYFPSWS